MMGTIRQAARCAAFIAGCLSAAAAAAAAPLSPLIGL